MPLACRPYAEPKAGGRRLAALGTCRRLIAVSGRPRPGISRASETRDLHHRSPKLDAFPLRHDRAGPRPPDQALAPDLVRVGRAHLVAAWNVQALQLRQLGLA